MEYLDTYDENKNFIGKEPRDYVHENGLWHNTVHCWLYDKEGNVYFQIRKNESKFYTTASGHVLAGESIKEGFGREIKEEIGLDINYESAKLVDVVIWKMDKEKPDGKIFRDRAFSNVYVCEFTGDYSNFKFDESEILGVVKVNASEVLELFKREYGEVSAEVIETENNDNKIIKRDVNFNEFLVQKNETALGKYGEILDKVIELTRK